MKVKSKKGFTLMEMLIVVAIIGVLAAIAIPVFSGTLDNTKKAADEANFRAAKGSSMVEYLNRQYTKDTTGTDVNGKYFTSDGGWVAKADIAKAYKAQSSDHTAAPYILAGADGTVKWDAGT